MATTAFQKDAFQNNAFQIAANESNAFRRITSAIAYFRQRMKSPPHPEFFWDTRNWEPQQDDSDLEAVIFLMSN